jgi:lipopolysaccharide/colanic/teichoic acid biosynthesis glycosyltransferase
MFYLAAKRLMDVVGALVGLAATALLTIPLAIVIKLDSPGPVFFTQERLGKDEKPFRIHKFRTMYLNAAGNDSKPRSGDERVTRVGRFLRRTSLDELPQFWDVLRGEMSLVGPRPERFRFTTGYQPWQRRRFTVKPGLTGWWQVNGRPQPMVDHIEYDIYYVDHCSLWLDVQILLRTFRAVISGEGAL